METAKNKNQKGQSVLEVLLASALFVIVATPLIGILLQSLQIGGTSNDDVTATQYAAEGLDAVRDIRNQSYASLSASAGEGATTTSGVWGFAGASTTFGKFTRIITVTSTYRDGSGNIVASGGTLDAKTMKVTSAVTWSNAHSVALSTYLTNWRASYGGGGYVHYRTITVTSSLAIASGTQTNFPLLVSSTLASWEPTITTSTGRIQNLCTAPNGGQEPCDLIFSSNSSCSAPLNFETESYTSSTGALVDWVNVPSLSASTTIYACYGNGSILADQSHPSSTWNGNYTAVYHLANTPSLSLISSASGGNTLSNKNIATVAGKIDGAGSFDGSSAYASSSQSVTIATPGEESAWTYFTGAAYSAGIILEPVDSGYSDDINLSQVDDGSGSNEIPLFTWEDTTYTDQEQDGPGLNSNAWHYIVATWNTNTGNTSTTIAIYEDGALATSSNYSAGMEHTTASAFSIGASQQSPGSYYSFYPGKLDEVRLQNGAFTSPSWIKTEYNNQSNPGTFYTIGSEN